MRWFMSHVRVFRGGSLVFGHTVKDRDEHPIAIVERWNREMGDKEMWRMILLSFCQVPEDTPEADVESHYTGG